MVSAVSKHVLNLIKTAENCTAVYNYDLAIFDQSD